jgi:hypothetical protein
VEIRTLAAASLCDILWVLQKVSAGELVAAQHILHSRVSEVNLKLWRELQLRKGRRLTSFGLGRGMDAGDAEGSELAISANLQTNALSSSAVKALETLRTLMSELVPQWDIPLKMVSRIYSACRSA